MEVAGAWGGTGGIPRGCAPRPAPYLPCCQAAHTHPARGPSPRCGAGCKFRSGGGGELETCAFPPSPAPHPFTLGGTAGDGDGAAAAGARGAGAAKREPPRGGWAGAGGTCGAAMDAWSGSGRCRAALKAPRRGCMPACPPSVTPLHLGSSDARGWGGLGSPKQADQPAPDCPPPNPCRAPGAAAADGRSQLGDAGAAAARAGALGRGAGVRIQRVGGAAGGEGGLAATGGVTGVAPGQAPAEGAKSGRGRRGARLWHAGAAARTRSRPL
jgi:hypothetical protein